MSIGHLSSTMVGLFAGGVLVGIIVASRDLFRNWLAGMFLHRRHLRRGDILEFGDGFAWVDKMKSLNVVLLTRDNCRHVVPNRSFLQQPRSQWPFSRQEIAIRIPIEPVSDLARGRVASAFGVASELTGLMGRTPALGEVDDADERALMLTAHAWIRDPDDGLAKVRSEMLQEVWDRMKAADMAIPVPTTARPTLH